MKKKVVIWLFMLILCSIAQGADILEESISDFGVFGEPECLQNGAVKIAVTLHKEGNVYMDNFIKGIAAYSYKTNQTIDLKRYWYDQSGYWFNEDYSRLTTMKQGDVGYFVSEEYLLNDEGVYTLIISGVPTDMIRFYPDATYYRFNFTCPGYRHSCRLNPKIESCYSDDDFFYATVSGLGYDTYSKVDMEKDVIWSLNYVSYGGLAGPQVKLPNSSRFEKRNNRAYITIPVEDLSEKIESLHVEVTGCIEGLHNTTAYSSCSYISSAIDENFSLDDIEDEAVKEILLNRTRRERPTYNVTIIVPDSNVEKVFKYMYSIIPFEPGAFKNLLIKIGTY